MPDVAPTVTSRPSLVQRLVARWREARTAALLRRLPHGEVGLDLPDPATLVPRPRTALERFAHPALWEVGVPTWMVIVGVAVWQRGWGLFWPQHGETQVLFALFQLLWIAMVSAGGKSVLQRRYLRLGREAYHRLHWREAIAREAATDARLEQERMAGQLPAPAPQERGR